MKLHGVRPDLNDVPACLDEGAGETAVFLLHGVGGGKEAHALAQTTLVNIDCVETGAGKDVSLHRRAKR